mgnify:CR=1 FL=1
MALILEINNITQTFKSGEQKLTVLDDVSFRVTQGDRCAIVGPSGSGKTTLLGLAAGLDRPTSGAIKLNNILLNDKTEDELSALRNEYVGFIFQSFQLIPTLTALENVMVPLELRGVTGVSDHAYTLLEEVGLGDRTTHYPSQLSGGEKQRVAIARAFINQPKILFADEPTGNLDADTGSHIEDLLFDINEKYGTTLVMVTHDMALAEQCSRIIQLQNGEIFEDSEPAAQPELS